MARSDSMFDVLMPNSVGWYRITGQSDAAPSDGPRPCECERVVFWLYWHSCGCPDSHGGPI